MKKIIYPDITVCNIRYPHPNTALKAIRQKCLDCCIGTSSDVMLCEIMDCPLWTRRFGIKPQTAFSKGKDVTEQEDED